MDDQVSEAIERSRVLLHSSASGRFHIWLNGKFVYGKSRDAARAAAAKVIEDGDA